MLLSNVKYLIQNQNVEKLLTSVSLISVWVISSVVAHSILKPFSCFAVKSIML